MTISMTRGHAFCAAVAAVLCLTACGSDSSDKKSDDEPSSASAGTKAPDTTSESDKSDESESDKPETSTTNTSAQTGQSAGPDKMPCAVATALVSNCQKCHGVSPAFGAPMPLVKYSDLMAQAKTDPSQTVAELALKRMNDAEKPMPPGAAISAEDKKTLTDWLSGGTKPAASDEGGCYTGAPTHDEDYYRTGLIAKPGETCYDLPAHQNQTADDTEPYSVRTGEHYEQFYFKVPWGADMVMTRFGGKFDNIAVVHHWLLFTSARPESAAGTHETTIGTTIGDSSELIGGWAVGGDNVEFPDDMGLELPSNGMLNAQWHYYNQGTEVATDASRIQVCAVPRSERKNIASLTFLGTENLGGFFGMPAKTVSNYSGSCRNNSKDTITIWGFTPHMHKLGRNMKVDVRRADGSTETVFDKPFDFNSQITYPADPLIVLQPGDSIASTCTFDNDTNAAVAFGPSTTEEMCYNFTMAYPAHALDAGNFSLIGAKNTCW